MKHLAIGILLLLFTYTAHSTLLTYEYEGVFSGSNSLFVNSGDTFRGRYTLDTTATDTVPHPDRSLETQTLAGSSLLAGTGWEFTVFSSVIDTFTVRGSGFRISIGDNSFIGDRYIVNFFSLDDRTLPLGVDSMFIQIDLFDSDADMLSSNHFASLPDSSLALQPRGHLNTINGDNFEECRTCMFSITSFSDITSVPEPPILALIFLGFMMISGYSRSASKTARHSEIRGRRD